MSKILIIDKNINDVDIFIDSLSHDTIYYYSSDRHNIINDINIEDIYLGLVYHNTRKCNVPYFNFNNFMPEDVSREHAEHIRSLTHRKRPSKSLLNNNVDVLSIINNDYVSLDDNKLIMSRESYGNYNFSYDFINFIITLRRRCQRNLYVDFITCSINADEKFQHDIDKLYELGIIVRYSTNDFGYQNGDYILEKPNVVDISHFYFTDKLSLWHHVLSGIGNEITKDQLYLYGISYVHKKYKLTHDITLPNNVYIKIYNGETFDGKNYNVTITGMSYGFIYVDECSVKYPVIKNLNVFSTIGANGGGILQAFCNNFKVINCKHTGLLSGIHAGGICTQPISNFDFVNGLRWGFKIIKCEHNGDITSSYVSGISAMGGIVGGGFGNNISNINICINVYIYKCVNNGNISNYDEDDEYDNGSAGICGTHQYNGCFGNNNYCKFRCKIKKCTNNGDITGQYNSGIITGCNNGIYEINAYIINGGGCFGNNNYGNIKCTIIDCLNNGNMTGYNNGGICGAGNNYIINSDTCIINGGGCFGNNNYGTVKCKIYKCINNGNIIGDYNSGLFNGSSNDIQHSNSTINGGGCFGNNNNGIIICAIYKCVNNGYMSGSDNGGLFNGLLNNIASSIDLNIIINGGGCFGNNNYGKFICKIYKCINNGNITGDASSGLFNNKFNTIVCYDTNIKYIINGGGCFGNNNYGLFNCTINNCFNNGIIINNYNAGICNGGYNSIFFNQNCVINGGGCFGNNNYGNAIINIYNCINNGNITGNACGGLFYGGGNALDGINIVNGGGCFGNNNTGILSCTLNGCANNGQIVGDYNGGICTGGCSYTNDNAMSIGGGCFGNYNKHIMTVKILNCYGIANIKGNNGCGLFSGIRVYSGPLISTQHFCAANYNSGTINVVVKNCNNKVNIIGESNGGIFNDYCGCYNMIQSNGESSVLNFSIDSSDICGFVVNLNAANSSGMLFSNYILCYNFNSINNVVISNCKFKSYIEGINCGVIAGIGINYSNDDSSMNKLYLGHNKFKMSGVARLFGSLLNVSSGINSQTIIKHADIYSQIRYSIMSYNDVVNTFNNIKLKYINLYSHNRYPLLQPNYAYEHKHARYT
jgi:hypothetical protein